MKIERHPDAASFLERVEPFLLADDATNGMAYGIAARTRDGVRYGEGEAFFATVSEDGAGGDVVLAALRTPPYSLVVSGGDGRAASLLAANLANEGVSLPGVCGPEESARAFAESYAMFRGVSMTVRQDQLLHVTSDVDAPRPGPGAPRLAAAADRPLLIEWFTAFDREAMGDGVDMAGVVDRHLEAGSAWFYEDDGGRVSMLVAQRTTPTGVRIGGVYTPPGQRARGYASRLVAAVTQHHLDDGAAYVSLFTDTSNPTSNAIYRAVGFEPVGGFVILDFS